MASVVRDRTDSRVRGDCRPAYRRQAGASHGVRRVLPSRQEDGWKSVPAGGTYVNLSNRLPLSIYVEGIERILSGATLLRGEHVARDIRFLRAAGVHLEDKVVARSVTAEHHKDLRRGLPSPRAPGTRLAGSSRWDEQPSLTRNKPIHHPSAAKRENHDADPTCAKGRPPKRDVGYQRPRRLCRGRNRMRHHRSRRRARCRTRARHRTARLP